MGSGYHVSQCWYHNWFTLQLPSRHTLAAGLHLLMNFWQSYERLHYIIFTYNVWTSNCRQACIYKLRLVIPVPPRFPDVSHKLKALSLPFLFFIFYFPRTSLQPLTNLQVQFHGIQSLLVNCINTVRALEGAFAEHNAAAVNLLKWLVKISGRESRHTAGELEERHFHDTSDRLEADHAVNIQFFLSHKLERRRGRRGSDCKAGTAGILGSIRKSGPLHMTSDVV
jgi:hypothetical protein